MRTLYVVAPAAMIDFVNLAGVGVNTVLRIPQQRVVFPRAFPEATRDQQGNELGVRRLTSSKGPYTRVLLHSGGAWG